MIFKSSRITNLHFSEIEIKNHTHTHTHTLIDELV